MALTTIDDRGLKTPIDLLDGEKIRLGTDNDIQIHHTSGSNYIEGALRIGKNDNVRITDAADNTIIGTNATSAYLTYDGNTKLETTTDGAKVTGTLETTEKVQVVNASGVGRVRVGSGNAAGVQILLAVKSARIVASAPIISASFLGSKRNWDELISMSPSEPDTNCSVSFPTKKVSALTSNILGLVLNLNEPLAPTNSKPTPE